MKEWIKLAWRKLKFGITLISSTIQKREWENKAANIKQNQDITNGEKIAGTGTIEIDGSVGPVGGVKQKVIAAKRANASLILVPTANFQEANVYSDENTSIVAVDSFEEALNVISDFSSR